MSSLFPGGLGMDAAYTLAGNIVMSKSRRAAAAATRVDGNSSPGSTQEFEQSGHSD